MQIAHSESGESVPRLDKAMEDFYSVLNQIELHLVGSIYLNKVKRGGFHFNLIF